MIVQKRTLAGCELAVIMVEPSDAPPVRCKGRVWVRVGPRRAIATAEEERRLAEKRRARDLPFDIHPGKDPRQFFPGAYIQFLRFEGTKLTDPIKDQKEIGGPLPDLLRMLDETF
jgi:predicted HTH transcriptional regulator